MLLALKLKLALTIACTAAPLALTSVPLDRQAPAGTVVPAVVRIAPADFIHRPAGDYTTEGRTIAAPLKQTRLSAPLSIMTHQVTRAAYQACVAERACTAVPGDASGDRPVTGVSFRDAVTYAAWLSNKTGAVWRLPTDTEWAFAAGSRFVDDVLPDGGADPAQRWLAQYDRETKGGDADPVVHPVGRFGTNEHGLADLAGNVWEWTATCFVREAIDAAGVAVRPATENCGVRVLEGRHRAYVTDFIRDARAGGCAIGKPPTHLGFRLVREARPTWWHIAWARVTGR